MSAAHIPQQPQIITNHDFLQAIFGEYVDWVHVTGFPEDPNKADRLQWGGDVYQYRSTQLDNYQNNNYYCISTFHLAEDGKHRRRKANHVVTYVIVIDDVNDKFTEQHVISLGAPEPSCRLRTSLTSEQWGYILDVPEQDRGRVEAMLDGLVAKNLCPDGSDPGMKGVTRYVRCLGSNTKEKYGTPSPATKLITWKPDLKYSMDHLAKAFDIDLSIAASEVQETPGIENPDHPIWHVLTPKGKMKSSGWTDVTCPALDQHTDMTDNGSAILIRDDGTVACKCNHGNATCTNLTGDGVIRILKEKNPDWDDSFQWKKYGQDSAAAEVFMPIEGYEDDDVACARLIKEVKSLNTSDLIAQDAAITEAVKRGSLVEGAVMNAFMDAKLSHSKTHIKKVFQEKAKALSSTVSYSWKHTNSDGVPKVTTDNIEILLQRKDVYCRFNEMNYEIELTGNGLAFEQSTRGELQINAVTDWIVQAGMIGGYSVTRIKSMLLSIGQKNPYHPFNTYLSTLSVWDGVDRVPALTATLRSAKPDLAEMLVRKWLIGVIAVLQGEGETPRSILVLQGAEYTGKSTWLKLLFSGCADAFLGEASVRFANKDDQINLTSYLCVELAEIRSSMSKKDIDAIKAFVTRTQDNIWPAYGTDAQKRRRRSIYCGSVNPGEYLHDQSDNTRFWTIACGDIDKPGISNFDIEQLWAQMHYEFHNNISTYRLEDDARVKLIESNELHRDIVGLEQLLRDSYMWEYNEDGSPAWGMDDRCHMKTQKMILGDIGWKSDLAPGLREILVRLTRQGGPFSTTVTLGDGDDRTRVKGKWWKMPPLEMYGIQDIEEPSFARGVDGDELPDFLQ